VARIVDVFARALTNQENLTTQIAESLMRMSRNPSGVAVVVEPKHYSALMMRGVEKAEFRDENLLACSHFQRRRGATRSEFLSLPQDLVRRIASQAFRPTGILLSQVVFVRAGKAWPINSGKDA